MLRAEVQSSGAPTTAGGLVLLTLTRFVLVIVEVSHADEPDPDRIRLAAIALGKALFWDMQVASDGPSRGHGPEAGRERPQVEFMGREAEFRGVGRLEVIN